MLELLNLGIHGKIVAALIIFTMLHLVIWLFKIE